MKILLTIIVSALIINGCSTPSYIAGTPVTPMFEHSRQFNAGGSFGTGGIQGSASFSIHDHLFIFGNASVTRTDSVQGNRDKYFEGGAGYYNFSDQPGYLPLGLKYNHLEILAGYGNGSSNGVFRGYIDPLLPAAPADYRKYFLQLNVAYSSEGSNISDVITRQEAGQTIRFSFLNYYRFNTGSASVNRSMDNLFFEYYLFTGVYIGLLKLEGSAGVVLPVQNKPEFGNSFFSVSIAASLNFNL